MKKILFILSILVIAASSCKPYRFTSGKKIPKEKSFTLDSTYELYVRQVYDKKAEDKRNIITTSQVSLNALPKEDLVEIEYLFVSTTRGNLLYISNIPDVHKKRYGRYYMGGDTVNAYDFRILLFGKFLDNETIEFKGKGDGSTDRWQIEKNSNDGAIHLKNIEERSNGVYEQAFNVDEALQNKITFKKVGSFIVLYHVNGAEPGTSANLVKHKIYLDNYGKNKYRAYMYFGKNIRSKKQAIFFNDRRIVYDPSSVID